MLVQFNKDVPTLLKELGNQPDTCFAILDDTVAKVVITMGGVADILTTAKDPDHNTVYAGFNWRGRHCLAANFYGFEGKDNGFSVIICPATWAKERSSAYFANIVSDMGPIVWDSKEAPAVERC